MKASLYVWGNFNILKSYLGKGRVLLETLVISGIYKLCIGEAGCSPWPPPPLLLQLLPLASTSLMICSRVESAVLAPDVAVN